jgi:hypothetical protein
VEVLGESPAPLSAAEIYAAVTKRSLFTFKARDPLGVLRAAIRNRACQRV